MIKKFKKLLICMGLSSFLMMSFWGLNSQNVFAFSGTNNTITEETLYNETNTYNVNGNCFDDNNQFIKTIVDVPDGSKTERYNPYQYNISYNMSQKNSNQVMNTTQITVLTHGLGMGAGTWSNLYSATNHGYGSDDFAYDSQSLINQISEEVGGANIYWADMNSFSNFSLYDITDKTNYEKSTLPIVDNINDISKHIIIVFNAKYPLNSNANIYYQFNYMLSKVIYDVKILNEGKLPKINLVGHSRGGLTNLQYALDHPDLVSTMVSLGTPYFGSTTARLVGEAFMGGPSEGLDDILDAETCYGYNNRWNNNYYNLYDNITVYAVGSGNVKNFV